MEIRNNFAIGTPSFGMALRRPSEQDVLTIMKYGEEHGFSPSRVEKALVALRNKQASNKHFDVSIHAFSSEVIKCDIIPKSEIAEAVYSRFYEPGCYNGRAIQNRTYEKLFGKYRWEQHPIKKVIAAVASVPKIMKTKIKEMINPLPIRVQHETNEATRLEAIVDKLIATHKNLDVSEGEVSKVIRL